jgi:hypothetical protein
VYDYNDYHDHAHLGKTTQSLGRMLSYCTTYYNKYHDGHPTHHLQENSLVVQAYL